MINCERIRLMKESFIILMPLIVAALPSKHSALLCLQNMCRQKGSFHVFPGTSHLRHISRWSHQRLYTRWSYR